MASLRGATWLAVLLCAAAPALAQAPGGTSTGQAVSSALPETRAPQAPGPSAIKEPTPLASQRPPRRREGTEVVGQLGSFQVAGDRVVFVAQPAGQRFTVLENLALERITRWIAEGVQGATWKVSGTVTEFRGANYVLIRRAVQRGAGPLDTLPGGPMMGDASQGPAPKQEPRGGRGA